VIAGAPYQSTTELIQAPGLDGRAGKAATAFERHRKRCLVIV